MIKKTCCRCKGRGGRFLAPRTRGRWKSPDEHRSLVTGIKWVICDLCHGNKIIIYPHLGVGE